MQAAYQSNQALIKIIPLILTLWLATMLLAYMAGLSTGKTEGRQDILLTIKHQDDGIELLSDKTGRMWYEVPGEFTDF